ncbi:PilZ domain-containing protein [Sphingomonas faeni]|uniref:PilZ domain-containing protein n=1 Tax=Sphingomonas faeni TaxID=185950 RepID=UPI00334E749E
MFSADYETARVSKRGAPRSLLGLDAELDGARRTLCRVSDISLTGARLSTYSALTAGSVIWLTLPLVGRISATVMWAGEYSSGCKFAEPLSVEIFEALLLKAGRQR